MPTTEVLLDTVGEPDEESLKAAELAEQTPTPPAAIAVLVVDLVLTVGGTGVGPRDTAPEATKAVIDKNVPGVAQAVRSSGQACGAVDACTSRGVCGVSGSTVVVNLAASRQAIRDGVSTIAPLVQHLIGELNTYSVQA